MSEDVLYSTFVDIIKNIREDDTNEEDCSVSES